MIEKKVISKDLYIPDNIKFSHLVVADDASIAYVENCRGYHDDDINDGFSFVFPAWKEGNEKNVYSNIKLINNRCFSLFYPNIDHLGFGFLFSSYYLNLKRIYKNFNIINGNVVDAKFIWAIHMGQVKLVDETHVNEEMIRDIIE